MTTQMKEKFNNFAMSHEIIKRNKDNKLFCPRNNEDLIFWLNLFGNKENLYNLLRSTGNTDMNIDEFFKGIDNIGEYSHLNNFNNIFFALKLKISTNDELKQLIEYYFPKFYNKLFDWNPIDIEPCSDEILKEELGPFVFPLTFF